MILALQQVAGGDTQINPLPVRVTLGSGEGNTLVVPDHDSTGGSVLAQHLALEHSPRGVRLVAMDTRAMLSVNGSQVPNNFGMAPGDEIDLGNCRFRLDARPDPSISDETPWQLHPGANAPEDIVHPVAHSMDIGREDNSDIQLLHGYVSRRHARVFVAGNGLWVTDLHSANGTFINGQRVAGSARLQDGDTLRFDEVEYQVSGPDLTPTMAQATMIRPPAQSTATVIRPPTPAPESSDSADAELDLDLDLEPGPEAAPDPAPVPSRLADTEPDSGPDSELDLDDLATAAVAAEVDTGAVVDPDLTAATEPDIEPQPPAAPTPASPPEPDPQLDAGADTGTDAGVDADVAATDAAAADAMAADAAAADEAAAPEQTAPDQADDDDLELDLQPAATADADPGSTEDALATIVAAAPADADDDFDPELDLEDVGATGSGDDSETMLAPATQRPVSAAAEALMTDEERHRQTLIEQGIDPDEVAEDTGSTMISSPASAASPAPAKAAAHNIAPTVQVNSVTGEADRPQLLTLTGPEPGTAYSLRASVRMVMGRSPDCDIVLPETSVSSRHCQCQLQGDQLHVENLISSNGIFINGERVTEAEMRNGDVLQLGRIELIYETQPGSAAHLYQGKRGLPPWLWMLLGFGIAAAAILGLML